LKQNFQIRTAKTLIETSSKAGFVIWKQDSSKKTDGWVVYEE